eukprot:GHUV01045385.1.p1 GENE.GHUV01045385.1~~GHUV01045385.1.p1  ORF type:complete len:129 (+),score=13.08 GHUV01045385.1:111-497(+)
MLTRKAQALLRLPVQCHWQVFPRAVAPETRLKFSPSELRLLLMACASLSRCPVAPLSFTRSLPARSIRFRTPDTYSSNTVQCECLQCLLQSQGLDSVGSTHAGIASRTSDTYSGNTVHQLEGVSTEDT